jgi:2-polyprenyl-6-methoxyphenol hydroxylase-like FAD-dependent oxidoreductase
MPDYDIITVGGGIGGSAIAKAMAERGHRVLVIERETSFKDRVRGEYMAPWGAGEAKKLGVYDAIIASGGQDTPKFAARAGPAALPVRDLVHESALGMAPVTMYHPAMQDGILAAAEAAGAQVRRGVKVTGVRPGKQPEVDIESDAGPETFSARLVVGADGRNSMVRKWGGFEAREEQPGNMLAGVILENAPCPPDMSTAVFNPFLGQVAFVFPQSDGKARAYFGWRESAGVRLQGDGDFAKFIEMSIQTGAPAELFEGTKQVGPLATFAGYDSWVEHPYKDGIALVGDAAQTSDQTWGQGLSITMRDARELRDALLSTDDWDAAGHKYAEAANWCFDQIRIVEDRMTLLMMDQSPEAAALRTIVLPRLAVSGDILPDTHFSGPELAPADDAARVLLFGE